MSRVELISGDDFQQAARQGRWSQQLVDAAMRAEQAAGGVTRQLRPDAAIRKQQSKNDQPRGSHAVVLTYKDGLKASVLRIGGSANRWNFACKLRGETKPLTTALYNGPWGNRCLFKALSHAIQHLFVHRRQPYAIERTLLVTGILDAAMRSHEKGGAAIETPHLATGYQPIDFHKLRESGASWKVITANTHQPAGFEPGDRKLIESIRE